MSNNPRTSNGNARRKLRARVAAMGLPCAICGKSIDYTLDYYIDPVDGKKKPHPLSYELDEIIPVSRYKEGGYSSPNECALDINNVRPTHRICNEKRSNDKQNKKNVEINPYPTYRAW